MLLYRGVREWLKKLHGSKTPGPGQMEYHHRILQTCDVQCDPPPDIFLTSFDVDVPDEWRKAKILLIYKRDSKTVLRNY